MSRIFTHWNNLSPRINRESVMCGPTAHLLRWVTLSLSTCRYSLLHILIKFPNSTQWASKHVRFYNRSFIFCVWVENWFTWVLKSANWLNLNIWSAPSWSGYASELTLNNKNEYMCMWVQIILGFSLGKVTCIRSAMWFGFLRHNVRSVIHTLTQNFDVAPNCH